MIILFLFWVLLLLEKKTSIFHEWFCLNCTQYVGNMKTKVKEEERGKKENNNNNKHTHKKTLLAFFVEVFAYTSSPSLIQQRQPIIKEKERAREMWILFSSTWMVIK